MKIEQMKLNLSPINMGQVRIDRCLFGRQGSCRLNLTDAHLEFLPLLQRSMTLREIADHFLDRGVFPSFEGLRELLVFLLSEGMIQNPDLANYLAPAEEPAAGLLESVLEKILGPVQDPIDVRREMRELPFFRSLSPFLFDLFIKQSRAFTVSKGIRLCTAGQKGRSLFVLLRGRASVLLRDDRGRLRKVATLPEGSTFGETGFLLGEPRTADVVTDEDCVVVQVAHDSNLFDPLIRTDRADGLRRRFWVIHSLLRSGIFRNIPSDCFDALVHSGHFREFESGQWLCREGQTGESCHLIVQGSVIVSQRQRNIRRLKQGDCFGEVALILSRGVRTASVYSQTDVLTLELSKASFYRLLAENFVLGCEFEKVAIQRWLADRERRTA